MANPDDLVAQRMTYVKVCFTTDTGETICIGVPGWEPRFDSGDMFVEPVPKPPVIGQPPVPGPDSREVIPIFLTDPRPVPWLRDLASISQALSAIEQLSKDDVADGLRDSLESAAKAVMPQDLGAEVSLVQ